MDIAQMVAEMQATVRENTRALEALRHEMATAARAIRPKATGIGVPQVIPDYAEENITGGTLTIVSDSVTPTLGSANCLSYGLISVLIQHQSAYITAHEWGVYVQLKGSDNSAKSGGWEIGAPLFVPTQEIRFVNLETAYWAPFIYAILLAPAASTAYPVRIRIIVIKRRS